MKYGKYGLQNARQITGANGNGGNHYTHAIWGVDSNPLSWREINLTTKRERALNRREVKNVEEEKKHFDPYESAQNHNGLIEEKVYYVKGLKEDIERLF